MLVESGCCGFAEVFRAFVIIVPVLLLCVSESAVSAPVVI